MINLQLSGTKDDTLLNLLVKAHQDATRNNPNASKELVRLATQGSGDFTRGVIAGLASIGGLHAPLWAARQVFRHGQWDGDQKKVPGFGNSFHKTGDPAFFPVSDYLNTHYKKEAKRLQHLTECIHRSGKKIYPNAALYTAAVCEILEIPDGMESLIFMLARIPVWAEVSLT